MALTKVTQTVIATGAISSSQIANGSITAAHLTGVNTDHVSEGSTNVYFSNARARSSLSGSTGVTYNSSTGAISIGQAVGTSDNVEFGQVTVDNITINGSTISSASSMTLDVVGNLTVNVDGTTITLADDAINFGQFYNNASGQFNIYAPTQDKDIVFLGNDGGSTITALTLDMSSQGDATFNNDILLGDGNPIRFGDDQDLRIWFDGNHGIIQNTASNSDIYIKGNDGGSTITMLNFDTSNLGKATFSGDILTPGSIAATTDASQIQLGSGNRAQIFHNSAGLYMRTSTGPVYAQADSFRHLASDASTDYLVSTSAALTVSTGVIRGPSTLTIDPAAHGNNTGTVIIAGDLQVDGTTTTINSTTMTVDDLNITLASGSANPGAANGAGITVDTGTGTDATITYDGTNDEWDFNKPTHVEVAGSRIAEFGRTGAGTFDLTISDVGDGAAQLWFNAQTNDTGFNFRPKSSGGTNTNALYIAPDSKVGIGTTSPLNPLHVKQSGGSHLFALETSYATDRSGRGQISWRDSGNITGGIWTEYDGTNVSMRFGNLYNSGYNTNTSMIIRGNGNVGIGTTEPSYKLQVTGSLGLTNGGGLHLLPTDASDTDAWILYQYTDNTLRYNFTGAGADEIIVTSPGSTNATTLYVDTENKKVGVGTASVATAPNVALTIGDTSFAYTGLSITAGTHAEEWRLYSSYNSNNDAIFGVYSGADSNYKLIVHENGNVGIGTSFPVANLVVRDITDSTHDGGRIGFGIHEAGSLQMYHSTNMSRTAGSTVTDSTSSGGDNVTLSSGQLYGPYITLPRGQYRLCVKMKTTNASYTGSAARISVYGPSGTVVTETRIIKGTDFDSNNKWETFSVPFQVVGATSSNIEYYAFALNSQQISVDYFFVMNDIDSHSTRIYGNQVIDGNVGIGTDSPGVELDIRRHTNGYPLRIGSSQGEGRAMVFADVDSSPTKYNFLAGTQYNVNNGFEITPSTAVGGYTFNAPAFAVRETGRVTIGNYSGTPETHLNIAHDGHGLGIGYEADLKRQAGMYTSNTAHVQTAYGDLILKARTDYGGYYGIGLFTASSNDTPTRRFTIQSNGVAVSNKGQIGFINDTNYIDVDQATATRMRFFLNGNTMGEIKRIGSSNGGSFRPDQYSTGTTAESYPAFAEASDENTGIAFPGADQISIVTGGTERISVVNTNVGIGSSTSALLNTRKLNVYSDGLNNDGIHTINYNGANTYSCAAHYMSAASSTVYHNIKTNISTANESVMFRVHVTGYNYGTGATIDLHAVAYAYQAGNSHTAVNTQNQGTDSNQTISIYKSSDNFSCVKIYLGSSSYYTGFLYHFEFAQPTGYNKDFEITSATFTSSSSNQY